MIIRDVILIVSMFLCVILIGLIPNKILYIAAIEYIIVILWSFSGISTLFWDNRFVNWLNKSIPEELH